MAEVATFALVREKRLGMLIQFGLLAGPFLSMVDSNVVNVAIPQIARSFGDSLGHVQWAVSGYLLALATGLGASAYLARRWGTREVYIASLVGFTLASLGCALAGTTAALVTARVIQGLCGAPLVPLAMGMLLGGEGARRQMSPAAGLVLFMAPALGPSLGGILISDVGWQSVFLINVPFGLLGLLGVLRMSPALAPAKDATARFDPLGLLVLSAGLAFASYGASQGPQSGWWSSNAFPFWSVGLGLLIGYVLWARIQPHPAVNLRILSAREPALALVLSVVGGLVLFAVLFLIPVFVQEVQGLSATEAGLLLLPQGIVMAVGTILGDILSRRRLIRAGVVAGMILLAVTTAGLTLIEAATPGWMTAVMLCGRGLALGLIIQPLLVSTLGQLPRTDLADANTLFNILERVAGSFGVALVATFFQVRVRTHLDAALGIHTNSTWGLNGLGPFPSAVRTAAQNAAVAGFHDTVWLLVALSGFGFLVSLMLTRRLDQSGVCAVIEGSNATRYERA